MKNSFAILILLLATLVTFSQNQPPVAVNDTVYGIVGDTVFFTKSFLLKNDYDPDGDSIFIKYVFGFQQVNDTTWMKKLHHQSLDSVLIGRYVIRDEHNTNSVLSDNIIIPVKGFLRSDFLNTNNINALISPIGQHFWDFETAHFEVPKGSGKHSVFSHTMWVGALKDGDTLCTAAERYRAEGYDFCTGPISTVYDTGYYLKWNRLWKIDKTQIRHHINNWNQTGYIANDAIANWPAHGDVTLGQSKDIAPFYDQNANGLYEPALGDYPLIRGDQAIFFVFNDAASIHSESKGYQLGIEVHGMAYEYDRPQDSTLNNTLFMHYDIINHSAVNYHDAYLGFFADFDLGFAGDDYIASDVTNGMMYGYNGTTVDGTGQPYAYGEYPPAIGLKIIGGPSLEPDGIDNLSGECGFGLNGLNFGDNVADNERLGMTNFLNMANQGGWQTGESDVAINYYNFMKSIWRDGTKMIYGGNGHITTGGLGPDCNFMFPGNSDTVCNYSTNGIMPNGGLNQNGNYWTEATVGNAPDDRRGVASIGPFNFNAGETIPLDYCFTWARDYNGDNISSAELLRTRIAALAPSWNTLITTPETYFGVPETEKRNSILVYPNPVKSKATVTNESTSQQEYMLFSINGLFIKQGILKPGNNLLDISDLKPGVYILKSVSSNVRIVKM
jgi:hypothetical protein